MSNRTNLFASMYEINKLHEEFNEKLMILKNNNQVEYHKYSLSIMNFIKSKSIIDSCYDQVISARMNKTLTENEIIDNCLKSLRMSLKFMKYSKEKVKEVFEELSNEYSIRDEIRSEYYNAIDSMECIIALNKDLAKRDNSLNVFFLNETKDLLKNKFDQADKDLNEASKRLTFSCDLLELIINSNISIEKCLEELDKDFILELADL